MQVLRIDPALEQAQIERVRALRERRNSKAATAALNNLEQASGADENLLPRILECVEAYATVGEISREQFEDQYKWMASQNGGYYILVIEDSSKEKPVVVGTGALIVERKL